MESRGWVRRDRSTEDRRTVHVTLTDSGLQALVEVEEMAIRRASMLLDCLSEAENLQLHDGLRALFGVVQEELGAHFEEQLHPEEAPGCTEQAEK